jgi:predicted dehydrogenase
VTGVVGASPERAREKARSAVLPAPYDSFEAMLADHAVDVVHVTSPNRFHREQALACLEAGKHVVCEKPLGMSSVESAEMLARAQASGLVHAVNFNIRFYPQCQEAAARVAAGEIGDVRLVSGSYLQDWLLRDTDWNWRLDPAEGGSLPAVDDIGSHWLDLLTFVTDRRMEAAMAEPSTVIPVRRKPTGPVQTFGAARGKTVDQPIETEDVAGVLLRFEGGARGVLTVSQISAGRKNHLSFEVGGAESALHWVSRRAVDRPSRPLKRAAAARSLFAERERRSHDKPSGRARRGLRRHVQGALPRRVPRCRRGGAPAEPNYPTFADGHEQALIAEAIARSARDGSWATVERGDITRTT